MRFLLSIISASLVLASSTPAYAQHGINNTPGFVDFCNNVVVGFIDIVGGFDSPHRTSPSRTKPAEKPAPITPKELKRYLVSDPVIGAELAKCADLITPSDLKTITVE